MVCYLCIIKAKLASTFQATSCCCIFLISLLLFSHPVMSDSLRPHGLQHGRSPCPSPSPGVCPSSRPLLRWCHPVISSSDNLFSFCPQSFPASGLYQWVSCSNQMTKIVELQHQSIQWVLRAEFPLRLTGLILLSKGLSGVFSNTAVQRHQSFGALPALRYSSHNCMWPLGRSYPWLYRPI